MSHFIQVTEKEKIQPGNLLLSFDVVSLLNHIPIEETLELIRNKYKPPRCEENVSHIPQTAIQTNRKSTDGLTPTTDSGQPIHGGSLSSRNRVHMLETDHVAEIHRRRSRFGDIRCHSWTYLCTIKDKSLDHTIWREKIHINGYLNAKSHHYPAKL